MIDPNPITADYVSKESYHNLVILSVETGFANPVAALKALEAQGTPMQIDVMRDEHGNILQVLNCFQPF